MPNPWNLLLFYIPLQTNNCKEYNQTTNSNRPISGLN